MKLVMRFYFLLSVFLQPSCGLLSYLYSVNADGPATPKNDDIRVGFVRGAGGENHNQHPSRKADRNQGPDKVAIRITNMLKRQIVLAVTLVICGKRSIEFFVAGRHRGLNLGQGNT